MNSRPAVAVRFDEHQIPDRVQRVDFELVVLMRVSVGIDEHFEVVVVVDDRVALRQRRGDVGLLEIRRDVQIFVIPEQLHPRAEGWRRADGAFDVDERLRPGGGAPGWLVQASIDHQRRGGAIADRLPGCERQTFEIGCGLKREKTARCEERHSDHRIVVLDLRIGAIASRCAGVSVFP
jgi:hypothetical protein